MDSIKEKFQKKIESINKEIDQIKRIDSLNSKLQKHNWILFHPYNQGFEIGVLERLVEKENNEQLEEKIFEIFARKFLNLGYTISITEGFYKKRPFIKDYSTQIDESIVSCLQKDFSGAIHLLIPVIEGSLRKYLISKYPKKYKHATKISDLDNAFKEMIKDYMSFNELNLGEETSLFDINQKKQIFKKEKEYFSLWIKQLRDYLNNKLYMNTRENSNLKDNFNRHFIFHGLGNVEYTFNNYLRLITCLNYLSWSFGLIHKNCSLFAEFDDEVFKKKQIEYIKTLIISEVMIETKESIYGKKVESFKKYMDPILVKHISFYEKFHKKFLKSTERLFK